MEELETGLPVERTWVVWHALIGMGAGTLFIPSYGPPIAFIFAFLLTSVTTIMAVRFRKCRWVIVGLVGLAVTEIARSIVIWRAESLGAGSQAVATYLWVMLAVGTTMEAYAVRNRGIT